MIRALYAWARRWVAVAVFGDHPYCMGRRCLNRAEYAAPDGGPGGVCMECLEVWP